MRVNIPSRDEVGKVGEAFNSMVTEIRYHTENLENLVEERTHDLEQANKEIVSLNEQLKSENLRMSAELDVAQHIQTMVLPRVRELEQPADSSKWRASWSPPTRSAATITMCCKAVPESRSALATSRATVLKAVC